MICQIMSSSRVFVSGVKDSLPEGANHFSVSNELFFNQLEDKSTSASAVYGCLTDH